MEDTPSPVDEEEMNFKIPSQPSFSPATFKLPSTPSSTPSSTLSSSNTMPSAVPLEDTIKPSAEKDGEEAMEVRQDEETPVNKSEECGPRSVSVPPSIPLPYEEPSWAGIPEPSLSYCIEVLKNGSIVQTVPLKGKSWFTIGRLANCDLYMEHPSLSRYHAVLQYRQEPDGPDTPKGFYLYDLDSTHGTWHNKKKCFPRKFYSLRVGHMMKFGGSTRLIILQGPHEDQEEESELGVTELMALAQEKAEKKKAEEEEKKRREKAEEEEREERERARGVSWGMDDDYEDDISGEKFPDMEKNPFAELAENEALYVDDPKKAIERWFEREGFDFDKSHYQITEKGYAHFHCRLDLPIETSPNYAEAEVKGGKKKEAEVQCALEACRVLDRLGLLRPSQQTGMERKVKKWEDDDFYASDEDEFIDRTGDINKKRKMRMKMAGKMEGDTIETYDSLLKKHTEVEEEIAKVEAQLKKAVENKALAEKRSAAGDLDSYLAELKKGAQVDKETVTKLKVKVSELCKEKDKLVKMINIAKPTNLPDLQTSATVQKPKAGVMVGRRPGKGLGLTAKMKTVSSESVPKPIVVKSDEIKVLEAFLEKDEVETKMKLGEEREIKPIGYDEKKPAKHEPSKKERIGAGDTASVVMKGPEIPAHIKEVLAQNLEAEESVKKQEISMEPSVENKVLGTLDVLSNHIEVPDQEAESEEENKRKRGDRGTKRNKKLCKEQEPEDSFYKLGEDRQYDVWLPPQGQTGDGKTSLNDKLGY